MDAIKTEALAAIDEARGSLVGLADRLHAHPEVGFTERDASVWLDEYLARAGFVVERPAGGMETAFVATMGSGSPRLAVVAEYDALPEVGHGCGHNLIAASAMGAALGVAAVLPKLCGTLLVIGTPAEERLFEYPGKVRLLKAGVFDGLDATIMYHPWNADVLVSGDRAMTTFDMEFHGKPAHAAADPWNGANALDGVMLACTAMNYLRQQLKPEVRMHWNVTHGGAVPNIIHSYASARVVVRAEDVEYLHKVVVPKVKDCARGAALATGTTVEIKSQGDIDSTRMNATLTRLVVENAGAIGIKFAQPASLGGSTDYGNVSRKIPSTYFMLDLGVEPGSAWHSKEVAAAAGKPKAHRSMLDAARIMAMSLIDLYRDPALLVEAWDEHPK
jgi:amidohydrolase